MADTPETQIVVVHALDNEWKFTAIDWKVDNNGRLIVRGEDYSEIATFNEWKLVRYDDEA